MKASHYSREMRTYRPEVDLLLKVSHTRMSRSEVAYCRELLHQNVESLDWGYFLDQACRHKVIQIVGRNITSHRLHRGMDGTLLIPYRWLYLDAYTGNKARNGVQYEEFAQMLQALNSSRVEYAVRKGPALTDHVYGDTGLRRMQDLDILVDRKDLNEVGTILRSHGYSQGRLNSDGTAVVPFKRSTHAFWKMFVNNDLPFIKISGRSELDSFSIDICLNIFVDRSPARVATTELLAHRVSAVLCGVDSYMLSPADSFIDLCAHLYKEATANFYIQAGTDLQLSKFLDIALSCQQLTANNTWIEVLEAAKSYRATGILYYALHYTSLAYPDMMSEVEIDSFRPASDSYLDEYGEVDGQVKTWETAFMDRLFSTHRYKTSSESSIIPFD